MDKTSGKITCQAAAFVYKDDRTVQQAWQDVQQISHIRAEIHDDRDIPSRWPEGMELASHT